MEPLRSPVVATGGNRSQIAEARNRRKQAKSVAVGCHPLPEGAHGRGVDGSTDPSRSASRPPRTSGPPAWNGPQVLPVLGPELPTERGFLVPVTNDQTVAPKACARARPGRARPNPAAPTQPGRVERQSPRRLAGRNASQTAEARPGGADQPAAGAAKHGNLGESGLRGERFSAVGGSRKIPRFSSSGSRTSGSLGMRSAASAPTSTC
jgi:hypothetical protein